MAEILGSKLEIKVIQGTNIVWSSNGKTEFSENIQATPVDIFTCESDGFLNATIITSRPLEFSDSHSGDYGVYRASLFKNGTEIANSLNVSTITPDGGDTNTFFKYFILKDYQVNEGDVFSFIQGNQNNKNGSCVIWEAYIYNQNNL